MERSPSEFLGGTGLDDQFDSLVNLLQYPEVPRGLDDLIPVGNYDSILKAELSDSDASRIVGAHLTGSGDNLHANQQDEGKRRRRIRNAKQQELNRLAQQRYRQRKKQKYSDLQTTVDELSEKMEIIARLEREAGEMKGREAAVQGLLCSRETALKQAQVQVQQQQRLLEEQQRRIGEQQQQLEVLKQQQQQPACSAASQQQQQQLSEPQQQLCDRLLVALREALSEVCQEHGLSTSSIALDQVLCRFKTSLSSCCREIAVGAGGMTVLTQPGVGSAAAPMPMPGSLQQPATAAAAAAAAAAVAALTVVPAAAAGQVKEAAHRVSVTCY